MRAFSVSASVVGGIGLLDDDAGEPGVGDIACLESDKSAFSAVEIFCLAARVSSDKWTRQERSQEVNMNN